MMGSISLEFEQEGQVARLRLNAPKANILDLEMIGRLSAAFGELAARRELKAAVLEGAGSNFSFGASVAEHQAGPAREMIPAFGRMLRALVDSHVPAVALVRGQCLGGGMELAACCNWIFAEPSARFGQPEIQLGVFPPAACLVLPLLVGQPRSDDLCLTGRTIEAEEARSWGLVHALEPDAEQAVRRFLAAHLLPKSAASLRIANRAARVHVSRALAEGWTAIERLYLDELVATVDANEGIAAFLEKRTPRWTNR
jgi:cyclohexa-1,5-dienecarbonyl-CoA hydratase